MSTVVPKVASRYMQKEAKKSQVTKLASTIKLATGISKDHATVIADTMVHSDIHNGTIEGPLGRISFEEARRFL